MKIVGVIVVIVGVIIVCWFDYVTAWRYIYSGNVLQGPCVYADFDTAATGTISVRKRRDGNGELDEKIEEGGDDEVDNEASSLMKRVVNGKKADITNWPWLVAILTPDGPISSYGRTWDINCGGTLIHPEFVLTAAHCVIHTENDTYYYRRNPQDLLCRIGDNDLYKNDIPSAVDILVDRTYTHPQYDPLLVDTGNDIALLHLSKRVERGAFDPLRVACLPQTGQQMSAGSQCYVAGWGAVSTDGDTSPVALYTSLQVATTNKCQRAYGFESASSSDGRLFCAGPPRGSRPTDTCTGDSGGGMFCKDPKGTGFGSLWQLIGVVSFGGDECAPRDLTPGVYTNVAYYRQWVLDTMSSALLQIAQQQTQQPNANKDPYTGWLPWYYSRFQNSWRR